MADTGKNIVHEQANWTIKINRETRAAKRFSEEWGWMTETGARELSRATSPAKYYNKGGVTVKSLRIPGFGESSTLPLVSGRR